MDTVLNKTLKLIKLLHKYLTETSGKNMENVKEMIESIGFKEEFKSLNFIKYFKNKGTKEMIDSIIKNRKEFEDNGFKVEEVYSDVSGKTFNPESPEIAIVARKL